MNATGRTPMVAAALAGAWMVSAGAWASAAEPAGQVRAFSYGRYAEVLSRHVDGKGLVNYAAMKNDRAALDAFVGEVGSLDPKRYEAWDEPARIAFWINVYNALTLRAVVDHYPIRASFWRSLVYPKNSIRQIPGVGDELRWPVMGREMTLEAIERETLGAGFREPRLHVALVRAAMGGPPLRNEPYVGPKLDEQLEDQASRFARDRTKCQIDRRHASVRISSIFKRFGEDFIRPYQPEAGFEGHTQDLRASLNFLGRYLHATEAAYLREKAYRVSYTKYDWSLNEQKPKDG